MKKLLGLFATMGLFVTTSVNVIACEENGDIKNDDPKNPEEKDTRIDLGEIQKELDSVLRSVNSLIPNEEQVLEGLKKTNFELRLIESRDLIIEEIKETTATIKAYQWSEKVKGEGEFKFNTKIDIKTISKPDKELHLPTKKPKKEDIIFAINQKAHEKNQFNIEDVEIDISPKWEGEWWVSISSKNEEKCKGQIELEYPVKIDLSKINGDLGNIKSEEAEITDEVLLQEVHKKNQEIDSYESFKKHVEIVLKTKESAIIQTYFSSGLYLYPSEKELKYNYIKN